ncbi:RND transporter [Pseudonocardia sp. Cha107L01]|uniref:RND transporter n=1 Tax=Pseudonocardia sp. Cha107L01 TaxID=3457576 RepID=UPI00403E3AE9
MPFPRLPRPQLPRPQLPRPRPSRPGPRLVAAVLVTLLLAAFTALGLARVRMDTTVASFLPADDPAVRSVRETARWFGGDPIVVLAESANARELLGGDQLPRLLKLEAGLARLPDVAVVYGPATVLNQIAGTAQNLLATISGTRDAIRAKTESDARAAGASPQAVADAVTRSTADFDARYAALLVRGLPAGLPTLRNPAFINQIVFSDGDSPRPEWAYVIPAPNAVAVLVRPREGLDQGGTERLVTATRAAAQQAGLATTRLTVSGSPTVAAEVGATVAREIPLLGAVAVLLIAGSYLLVPWTRRRAHRLLPLAATLTATALTLAVFGWLNRPLSLGVVAFLPIVTGIGSDFPAYLMHRGTPRGRIALVAPASAVGFAALALSPLPFVRDLGLALALGVLLAVAVALGLRALVRPEVDPGDAEVAPETGATGGADRWLRLGPGRPGRLPIVVAAVLTAVLGWVVLPRIDIEARPDMLAAGLSSVTDARHVEDVLGSSGEVEVLLSGPSVRTPEALAWMRTAEDTAVLRHGSQVRPVVSLPDLLRFLGPTPTQPQFDAALGLLPHYLVAAVLNDEGTRSVISLGLSLQDLAAQRVLLDDLRAALPPPPPGMTVQLVGLPVAAARGFELVSQGRYLTNLVGILAAGLVLLAGLWRRPDGVRTAGRAVLAAALATGWGLAGAWLLGVSLSPLSVALGSLTTATACEFTAVLSVAAPRTDTPDRRRLRLTVGVAALAACLGYLVLTASRLSVIRDFGLLLAATVALSLLASHLVVRAFPPRRGGGSQGAAPDQPGGTEPTERAPIVDAARI